MIVSRIRGRLGEDGTRVSFFSILGGGRRVVKGDVGGLACCPWAGSPVDCSFLILHELPMERFTISLDESLARAFDGFIAARGYSNRSEAVRDLIRAAIEQEQQQAPESLQCVANLSYVFNHHERELAERLTALQHDHHDLTVAAMHSHLDHEHCLESVILRGPMAQVRAFADRLCAERGVRHGQLNVVALEAESHHAHDGEGHEHTHFRPVR